MGKVTQSGLNLKMHKQSDSCLTIPSQHALPLLPREPRLRDLELHVRVRGPVEQEREQRAALVDQGERGDVSINNNMLGQIA